MRRLAFHAQGWEDFTYWARKSSSQTERLISLILETLRDPYDGRMEKPESLERFLPGAWSRRITVEHRLVYLVTAKEIVILQARYHY